MAQNASVEGESQEVETDTSGVNSLRPVYRLGIQLIFPLGVLVFAGLYVQNTYGRLDFQSLFYPYTIIVALFALIALVVVQEVRDFRDSRGDDQDASTNEQAGYASLESILRRSQKPLLVAATSVAYLFLIGILGFFPASALTLVGLMRASGVESWPLIGIVTVALLLGIWLMFVQVLSLQVPQGTFGV